MSTDEKKITSGEEATQHFEVKHDALKELKQQQDALSKAIQQHPDEPEIQDALRAQKDALGAEVKRLQGEHGALKASRTTDAGGAGVSSLYHEGGLADYLVSEDPHVKVIQHKVPDLSSKKSG